MEYAAVFLAGVALGILYFGGLWLTTRSLTRVAAKSSPVRPATLPALHLVLSFVIRMGGALVCLYLLMQGNWLRALVALLGMLVARFLCTWWLDFKACREVRQ